MTLALETSTKSEPVNVKDANPATTVVTGVTVETVTPATDVKLETGTHETGEDPRPVAATEVPIEVEGERPIPTSRLHGARTTVGMRNVQVLPGILVGTAMGVVAIPTGIGNATVTGIETGTGGAAVIGNGRGIDGVVGGRPVDPVLDLGGEAGTVTVGNAVSVETGTEVERPETVTATGRGTDAAVVIV
jgi:hypothetical protein